MAQNGKVWRCMTYCVKSTKMLVAPQMHILVSQSPHHSKHCPVLCFALLCCSMCSSLLSSRLLLYRLFYFAMLCCSILFTKYLSKKNFGSLFCFGFLCYHLVFCTFLNKALLYSTILCSFCLKIIFGVTICQAIQHCLVLCCVMQRCNAFQ